MSYYCFSSNDYSIEKMSNEKSQSENTVRVKNEQYTDNDNDIMEIYHYQPNQSIEKENDKSIELPLPEEIHLSSPLSTMKQPPPLCIRSSSPTLKRKRSTQVSPLSSIEQQTDAIPTYLMCSDGSFEQMIEKITVSVTNPIHIEILRQIAILIHHCTILDLKKSLWLTFLKLGTGTLDTTANCTTPKYWPIKFKCIIGSMKNINQEQMTDENYLTLTKTHLHQFEDQESQYQMKLNEKTKHLLNYSTIIEPIIRTFIQENLRSLRIGNDYEITLMGHEYKSQQLDSAMLEQGLTNQQVQLILDLYRPTYEYEKSKEEVAFLQQQNKLYHSIQSVQIPLPCYIDAIHDPILRQHVSVQHQQIIQQHKNDMMKSFAIMAETYMIETEKLFSHAISKFWDDQCALPPPQRLNSTVLKLIEQRLTNITERIQTIYSYRRYQKFGSVVPMQ